MDFKSHAQNLAQFLQRYTPLWSEEIMNQYPQIIADYPPEWILQLDTTTTQELFDIDCKRPVARFFDTGFYAFTQEIKELTAIDSIPLVPELSLEAWAFHGVKRKKTHEIQKIVPILKKICDEKKFEYVVDVGGGVGHLSRVLSHYHQIPSVSIDQNQEFQLIGLERLKKFRKMAGARDVTFKNLTFGSPQDQAEIAEIFSETSFSLGLHTCGALACGLIKTTIERQNLGLLSFGCCYYRINPETDFPLSHFYRDNHFPKLNLFALSLATRSHAAMNFETYQTKERVKNYRYALHLFLMEHFNNKFCTDVGECHLSVYWKPFHCYIRSKLSELKISHTFTDEYFDQFYSSSKIQKELRVMFLCNIIRWQFGRALEVYLQLDRCLYLQENNFEVKLEQYFDENLSPRNLGILALPK